MNLNLASEEKNLIKWLVQQVEDGKLAREFRIAWRAAWPPLIAGFEGDTSRITKGRLESLADAQMISCVPEYAEGSMVSTDWRCTLRQKAYNAVASNFSAVDTPWLTKQAPDSIGVNLLEIRLRDFIDHRLTAVVGLHYWKRTMPGDVITTVKRLIEERLSRHPYEDPSQFALGRRRLDFCDVSHYEKIILKNWAQFEEFFQRKEEFQRHIAAYRTLRNCVQHNRQPSDIEQQLGDAAMTWLGRILDQYEQKVLAPSEEDEEELTTTVVAGPSPEARQVGTQKKELAERHLLRREFWTQLLERAKEKTLLHARRSPTTGNWLIAGGELAYRYAIRMGNAQVGLRIRRDTIEESKRVFDSLYANRDTIERAFGDRLEWQRLDHQLTSHIQYVIPGGGLQNKDRWPEIQDRMIDAMVRLERALKPEIQRLK